jgi:2-keto-3-deoxy-L-rhamnonate aldolase RhmA
MDKTMNKKISIPLKSKIKEKVLTIGSWLTIGHPAVAEILANAGFDWLVIDLEHSTIGVEKAGELIRIIDLCGVSPFVRLTSNDPDQIKRLMDAGAHGIIVPMVNRYEDAMLAVASTRYQPKGTRGVGLGRAQGYGTKFSEYFEWQNKGPVVIVQIEHIDAIEQIDKILTVPGVDGFLIGPYDLSCSMGIPGQFNNNLFKRAMNQICEAGKRHNCIIGIHIVEPDIKLLTRSIKEGYTFIAYGVDMRILDVGSRIGMAAKQKAEQ